MGATLRMGGLQAFIDGLPKAIDQGDEQTAKYIADLASQLAPKDTGGLADSILAEKAGEGWQVVAGRGLPDERAPAQEYGTIYQEAQSYMGPAVKEIDPVLEYAKAIADLAKRSGVK